MNPGQTWIVFLVGSLMGLTIGSMVAWLVWSHCRQLIVELRLQIWDLKCNGALKPMRDERLGEPCRCAYCTDDNYAACERRRN